MADQCRTCHRPMRWVTTVHDKAMPLDVDPVPAGNVVIDATLEGDRARVVAPGAGTHVAHFVTCPQASQHRTS